MQSVESLADFQLPISPAVRPAVAVLERRLIIGAFSGSVHEENVTATIVYTV
jgi:hypothetical protein